jgi:hypothetical protein
VFDLGTLGNKFEKVEFATITQKNLAIKTIECLDTIVDINKQVLDSFAIVKIIPVKFSESTVRHLIIVTVNGDRIFINFRTERVTMDIDE